ncbi:protein ELF4-LIKE 3-like [Impatiens glandulifera]|uniref:protein ELF4-LIKE 3-like n=1 Tax=Impatiens glandulifera TaxID=253017 RepID=UPI001FB052C9|nr:protein ELF4-LIKE 3-like [Impatiens glandulifera]
MDGDLFSAVVGGTQLDGKVLQTFQKSFGQVQNILEQNRLLINEINQNHDSKIPDKLSRNVGLIRELNNNIKRVVDLYGDLSTSFSKSMEASSEGDSSGAVLLKSSNNNNNNNHGKAGGIKRNRPS